MQAITTGPQTHGIGDPSDEETHYVELINRARRNPVAEAARLVALADVQGAYSYYKVDLNLFQTQMATLPATCRRW